MMGVKSEGRTGQLLATVTHCGWHWDSLKALMNTELLLSKSGEGLGVPAGPHGLLLVLITL
jgi:hypothetical protein